MLLYANNWYLLPRTFPSFSSKSPPKFFWHLSLPLVLSLVVRDCLTVGSIIPYGFSLPLEPITLAKEFDSWVLMWPKREQHQWSSCLFLGHWDKDKDALYVLCEMRKQSPRDWWQLSGDHERQSNSTECIRERETRPSRMSLSPWNPPFSVTRNNWLHYYISFELSFVTSSWEKNSNQYQFFWTLTLSQHLWFHE